MVKNIYLLLTILFFSTSLFAESNFEKEDSYSGNLSPQTLLEDVNMCQITMSTDLTGNFYDSGGPNGEYSSAENCSFLIDPGCSQNITMTFTAFDLEDGFDYLNIYDGTNASAPLIGTYTGTNGSPGTIVATSGKMFIVFTSDGSVTRLGWEASWTATAAMILPVAEFSVSNNNPPLNVPVSFMDMTTEFPSVWNWSFGDGGTSTEQNPSHAYSTAGSYEVSLITENCFGMDTVAYPLVVQSASSASVNPTSISTALDCNTSTTVDVVLTNNGAGDLVYQTILGDGWAQVTPTDGTLSAGANQTLTVELDATDLEAGTHTDDLEILTNDPLNPSVILPITIVVGGDAAIGFNVTCLDFPEIPQNGTTTLDLLINNDGCDVLEISNILSDDPAFTVSTTQATILPYGSTTVQVTFSTTTAGSFSSNLNVISNVNTASVCLNAVALGTPLASVNPTAIDVDVICGTSTSVDLTLTNIGLGNLDYTASLGGVPISSTSTMVYTTDGATTDHIFNAVSIGTDSIFVEVTLNGDFDNSVEFADLYIDGNFLFQVQDDNFTNGTDMTYNYVFTSPQIDPWISDGVIEITLDNSLDVDTDQGGTNTHTVSLETRGNTWADVSPTDGLLSPGASQILTIDLDASNLLAGTYTDDLEILSNDPLNPVIIVPVTMVVDGDPIIGFDVTCLDFPEVLQNTSTTLEFLVNNDGCDVLEISNVFADDPAFTVSTTQATIQPYESATMEVSFSSATVGAYSSNLNFVSNINTASLCVSGTILAAPLASVNPTSIDVTLDCGASTTVDVTLSNTGLGILDYQASLGGVPIVSTSAMVYNTDGASTDHTFTAISLGTDSIFIEVTLNGDFDNAVEHADLYIDGNFLFEIQDDNFTNGTDMTYSYVFTSPQIDPWISDGVIEVTLDNSLDVDTDQGGTNTHTVTLETRGNTWADVTPTMGTLASGSDQVLTVTLDAANLLAGTYTDNLEITTNDPLNPIIIVPVTMVVDGDPIIGFNVTCLDFPETFQNATSTLELVVSNDGCSDLNISNIFADDPDFTVSSTQATIPPYETAIVEVNFSSATIGTYTSNLNFVSNINTTPVCVSGIIVGAPIATVTPTAIVVDLDCNETTSVDVTLSNTGIGNLSYDGTFGAGLVVSTSSIVYNVDGAATDHIFTSVSSQADSIFLEVTLNGDFDDDFVEFADLYIDGNFLFQIMDDNLTNGTDMTYTFAFGSPQIDNWVADGVLEVTIDNSLDVDTNQGGTNTHTVTLTSGENLWAAVSPENGTITSGASQVLTIDLDGTGLSQGSYTEILEITTNDPLNPLLEVLITLNMGDVLCGDFLFDQPSDCGGEVNFMSNTVNTPTSYLWDFGDGTTSTAANPTHLYASSGNYTVTLTVSNAASSDVVTQSVFISQAVGPITACTVGSNDITPTFDISHVVLNTIDNETGSFSNGYTDFTCDLSTTLVAGMPYDLTIEGYDFDEEHIRVWIDLNNNGLFTADELLFEQENTLSPHTGVIVVPENAVFGLPLRMRVACESNFAILPQGCTDLVNGEFEDYTVFLESNMAPPVSNFVSEFIDECQGVVQFTDESTNFPDSWSWDFGDNSGTSTLQNPIYTYQQAGVYQVVLTTGNDFGTSEVTYSVTINALNPVIEYTGVIEVDAALSFEANANGAISWMWDFGDGTTSNQENPTHTYSEVGTFMVTLTITNGVGCTASTFTEIAIVLDGTEELERAISIFPNPTSGTVFIKNVGLERYSEIEVVNNLGQVLKTVQTAEYAGDTYSLNLDGFATGVYLVSLKFADRKVLNRRVVLTK